MLSTHLFIPLTVCYVSHTLSHTHTPRVLLPVKLNSFLTGMTHLPGYSHTQRERLFHSLICHAKNAAMLVLFFSSKLLLLCSRHSTHHPMKCLSSRAPAGRGCGRGPRSFLCRTWPPGWAECWTAGPAVGTETDQIKPEPDFILN